MKLDDVYKNKKTNELIQIDSFATHIGSYKNMIIVYSNVIPMMGSYGSSPSFNGYGTQEEIENEYELLVTQEDLGKYENWEEIFELVNK